MEEKKLSELLDANEKKVTISKPKPVKTVKKVRPKPEPTMTFDRWFISLGRPLHHKAGMVAFAKTKGKRSSNAWYKLFKAYGITRKVG